MDANTFLQRVGTLEFFEGQVAHVEDIPARDAVFGDVPGGLHAMIQASLGEQGIERLYSHQAAAIEHVREGRNVVIVTGTASP